MAKAPVVTELALQNVRFLFGTMVDLRMLPQVLEQTGKAEVGEFKLVAHFPADEKAANNEAGYLARHQGFRGGDYNTYHGDPYTLDEIIWDATGRAGIHLVTKTKYGQLVEFPTIPDKNDTAELMLIVSEYVESIKTPPLIVRCSGFGGSISPLGNKKYQLNLTTGVTKCPTSIKDHVPKKYHAEDTEIIPHVGGPYVMNAEDLSPAERSLVANTIVNQMQGYYRTGVIGTDPVIGAFPNGPMSISKRTPAAKQDFFREPAVQDEDGFWNKGPNRWQAHKIARGVAYDQLEKAREIGALIPGYRHRGSSGRFRRNPFILGAEDFAAERKLMCAEHDDYFNACGCTVKNASGGAYIGSGSLMDISKDTGLDAFTPGELATSSAIHGDFDQASLNYSGKQNLEVRTAEEFAAVSTASPNLSREKANLRAKIRDEVDANFEWNQCVWGPYALRMEGASTNKFYIIFVYDNGKGVYRALGGYGGLGQNPRLQDEATTRSRPHAEAAATRKLKAKERKGYFTYNAEENRQPPWSATNPRPNRRIECGECDARGFIAGKECTKCDGAGYWNIHSPRCATCETDIQWTDGAECDECDEWYCDNHLTEDGECKVCGNTSLSFHSEDIPVWNDGIVEWETSGPMSPTGSGYSSASVPPTGVIAGPGDTFLNYTDAQNYLVESSGGLWGAEDEDEDSRKLFTPVGGYKCDGCGKTIKEGYNFQDINVMWHIDDGDFTGDYDMKDHLGGYNDWFCIPCAENAGYAAEEFAAMARIDPKKANDVANVVRAIKSRYQGIKINKTEYITDRRGTSNKYHVFAFTNRGVFNGYGRIGKTMTIFGPMSESQGLSKLNRKFRQGYEEQR